jgi:hypothetical protein
MNRHLCTLVFLSIGWTASAQVTTSQYDNARTGANLHETQLTPGNVNAQKFGKLFSLKVDGDIYAQPLLMRDVPIPGKGRHDVLFIATEHDTVYAFDAYGNPATPLWQVSLLKDKDTTVSANYAACPFIAPEIGITSTPVIDPRTGTLYVLARTEEGGGFFSAGKFHQHLHALAVTTGVEKFGGPVEIRASMHGRGDGSSAGELPFGTLRENPRASLLLVNGVVFLSWGSACDVGPYHGWVIAYDAQSLRQKAIFNASPDADDSGIWAGDTGPAADDDGNIFVATGNGLFDVNKGGRDYGDSLLKLNFDGQTLKVGDYFAPFDADDLNTKDQDLGSGGPVLLPDQTGPYPHLALIAGKDGVIYVINRDHMGHYRPQDDDHAVQTVNIRGGVFGSMAYWNRNVYVTADRDVLRDFEVKAGRLSLKATGHHRFAYAPATPTVSANGLNEGIVWFVGPGEGGSHAPAVLYAYQASDVTHELYDSEQNSGRDRGGPALRFTIPTVYQGHVYVGARRELDVYGLLPASK